MDLNIINQIENQLLERMEITFTLAHPGEKAPGKDSVRETIAKQMNTKKSLIVIDNIRSIFGTQELKGVARIYKKADRLQAIEREHLLKRNKLFQGKKEEKKEE